MSSRGACYCPFGVWPGSGMDIYDFEVMTTYDHDDEYDTIISHQPYSGRQTITSTNERELSISPLFGSTGLEHGWQTVALPFRCRCCLEVMAVSGQSMTESETG